MGEEEGGRMPRESVSRILTRTLPRPLVLFVVLLVLFLLLLPLVFLLVWLVALVVVVLLIVVVLTLLSLLTLFSLSLRPPMAAARSSSGTSARTMARYSLEPKTVSS